MKKEAQLYRKLDGGAVECGLCSHRCTIQDGKQGICKVRYNRIGTLYTATYGGVVARNIDPIEKKPLYHVKPGSRSFSIGTFGCNFTCEFCQNADLSQMPRRMDVQKLPQSDLSHDQLAHQARRAGCETIAFTYNEPTLFYELARDCAKSADELGIGAVFVSNGFLTAEAFEGFKGLLVAANIDLKTFRDENYRKTCGGRLQPVLDTIERMWKAGTFVEATTLVVPGFNDSDAELLEIAGFLASVSVDLPWHVSAFHPCYRMTDRPPTPTKRVLEACEIGFETGLRYVYAGNLRDGRYSSTRCPSCGGTVIERSGFQVLAKNIDGNRCASCGFEIAGIF